MPLDVALYLTILALIAVAYLLGHRDGHRKGHEAGYMQGHREGQKRWIAAMEARRGPGGSLRVDDHDALLRVVPPSRETL